jgi:ABC-2 type transport system ATP-binding protein
LEREWIDPIEKIHGVHDVRQVDQKLVINLEDPEQLNPKIIRLLVGLGADIQFVGELRHSLEEIYLQTMEEETEQDNEF